MIAITAPIWSSWPRHRGEPPSLAQAVTLALLLHLLLVAVFGSAPPGTAKLGEGLYGPINVILRGAIPGPSRPGAAAPDIDVGPPGNAPRRRWGGAVREADQQPPDPATPGAARVGTWSAGPPQPAADRAEPTPAPARDQAPTATETPAPALQPQSRKGFEAEQPAAEPPPTVAEQPQPAPEVTRTVPRAEPAGAVSTLSAPPRPAPLERAATTALEREVAAPAPLRPLATPSVPLAPLQPLQGPAIAAPPAPLPQIDPPPLRELPSVAPRVPDAAAPLQRLDAPAATAPIERIDGAPIAAPLPAAPAPAAATPAPAAEPPPVTRALPTAPAAAGRTVDRPPTPGLPDAGAQRGHDVAGPPSAPASVPKLDLDLPRARGGEVSSQGSRGLLLVVPHPPEKKSKLAQDIENAAKKDCRTAYAGAGLLAVLPMVADAAKGQSCKW